MRGRAASSGTRPRGGAARPGAARGLTAGVLAAVCGVALLCGPSITPATSAGTSGTRGVSDAAPASRPGDRLLRATCDTLEAILRAAVPAGDTAIHFERDTVTFEYIYVKGTAPARLVRVTVNDTTPCPTTKVEHALTARGWDYHYGYSADGDDGTVIGFTKGRLLCVLEGRWDGGDPTDSTYVPRPGCEVTVTCVARRMDDTLSMIPVRR